MLLNYHSVELFTHPPLLFYFTWLYCCCWSISYPDVPWQFPKWMVKGFLIEWLKFYVLKWHTFSSISFGRQGVFQRTFEISLDFSWSSSLNVRDPDEIKIASHRDIKTKYNYPNTNFKVVFIHLYFSSLSLI